MRTLSFNQGKANAGFTLIEILVVIFIISIITTVTLLSIHTNKNRQVKEFTNTFYQLLTLAQQQAMLQSLILGVVIENNTYYFAEFVSLPKGKTDWIMFDDHILKRYTIPNEITMQLTLGSNRAAKEAQTNEAATTAGEKNSGINPSIVFSTSGDVTPFAITIGGVGQAPRYIIQGFASGEIALASLREQG